MIDWKVKLTSRKFWMAIIGFVSGILLSFKVDAQTVETISGIILSGASVIAYIIGEGLADAAHANDGVLGFTVEDDSDTKIADDGDDRK